MVEKRVKQESTCNTCGVTSNGVFVCVCLCVCAYARACVPSAHGGQFARARVCTGGRLQRGSDLSARRDRRAPAWTSCMLDIRSPCTSVRVRVCVCALAGVCMECGYRPKIFVGSAGNSAVCAGKSAQSCAWSRLCRPAPVGMSPQHIPGTARAGAAPPFIAPAGAGARTPADLNCE
jgi:hypothetical protein